ncbi:MAG: c-type cytochrome [Burkholderiales bacterium]|jgi:cytochrome c|nr:c-type cytochrome [Burkholderiales bacterium]
MKPLLVFAVSLCLFGNADPVLADKDMLIKNNCFACHGIDKRKYGPKFVDVARKYANEEDAVPMLARKIRAGGSGVWGEDIMPPQAQVSEDDAVALAKYILSLQ